MVMLVAAPDTAVVYQISVVVLFVELPVDDIALVQVAPVCVILVKLFVVLLRVDITAISVFPVVGVELSVTLKDVAVLVPVFPVAV